MKLIVLLFALVAALNQNNGRAAAKLPLTITIRAEALTIKSGMPVSVKATLENHSSLPLDASACYCGPSGLDSAFTWEVRDNGRLTAKKTYPHAKLATGSAILGRIVEPKTSMSTDQEVNREYDMAKPGEYTIQASREIPKEMGGGVVKSNVITVSVIP